MSVVEDRIVKMSFDNANFEKNVATSMSTLERLKSALKFGDSTEGLDKISSKIGSMDFGGLNDGIATVQNGFSVLEQIAIGALRRIGDTATTMGMNLVKSLSVDQISSGWEKFGNKTTSVATLVSQGYELELVNEQLDRLNWFTDETSYNFVDMVGNIGKFTAAGQGLEESVTAMEGIALWAALSGQNAGTASRSMYQLSQAMSKGALKYDDWKSIQNASMDTVEFRTKALEAAEACGVLYKDAENLYHYIDKESGKIDKTANTINDMFTSDNLTRNAWLTTDVMMETFNTYSSAVDQIYEYAEEKGITASEAIEALNGNVDEFGLKAFRAGQEARTWADVLDSVKDAVSTGWMNTFENIFGNYEEAKTLWTDLANGLYDVFAEGGNQRNEILGQWKELGGRDLLFSNDEENLGALYTLAGKIVSILDSVKEAFADIFPPATAEQLLAITQRFKDFIESLTLSEEHAESFKSVFRGVFAAFDIVIQAVKALGGGLASLISYFAPAGAGILSVAGNLGDWLVNLDKTIKSNDTFGKSVQTVVGWITTAFSAISNVITPVIVKISGAFETFKTYITGATSPLALFGKQATETGEEVKTWSDYLLSAKESVITFATALVSRFKNIQTAVENLKSWFLGLVNTIKTSVTLDAVKMIFKDLGSAVKALWEILKKVGGYISETLKNIVDNFSAGNAGRVIEGGLFGALLLAVRNFFSQGSGLFKNIKEMFGGVTDVIESVGDVLEGYQHKLNAEALKDIATAMIILAGALAVMASIDTASLGSAVIAMGALFTELGMFFDYSSTSSTGLMDSLKNLTDSKSTKNLAASMIEMAAAIGILALACKSLSELSWEGIAKGAVAIELLMAELAVTESLMQGDTFLKGSAGLLVLAESIVILSKAMIQLSGLSWQQIAAGLASVGGLLLELSVATKIMSGSTNMMSTGVGLIAIAGAMKILVGVISDLGTMDYSKISQGLLAFMVVMSELAIVVAASSFSKNMTSVGVGLIAVAGALKIVVGVIDSLGSMDLEELVVGLSALGVVLAELGIATAAFSVFGDGAGPMLLIAAALLVLSESLKVLSGIEIEKLGGALLILTAALTALVVAGVSATAGVPGLLALSAALVAFGVAAMGLGAGIALICSGILALAAAFALLQTAGPLAIAAVSTALSAMIATFIQAIPAIIEAVGEGLLAVIQTVTERTQTIIDAVIAIGGAIIEALTGLVPQLIELVTKVLNELLQLIIDVTPNLMEAVGVIISSLIQMVADKTPEILAALATMLLRLMDGITEFIPQFIEKGIAIILALLQGFVDAQLQLINGGVEVIVSFIEGLAEAIRTNTDKMVKATDELVNAMIYAIKAWFEHIVQNGIEIVKALVEGITQSVGMMKEVAAALIQGLIDGLKDKISDAVNAAKDVGSEMLSGMKKVLGIHSPSKEFYEVGAYAMEGMANGFRPDKVDAAVEKTGRSAIDKMKAIINPTSFGQIATTSMDALTAAILGRTPALTAQSGLTGASAFNAVRAIINESSFGAIGIEAVIALAKAFKSETDKVTSDAKDMSEATVSAVSETLTFDRFFEIARRIVQGIVDGIHAYASDAIEAARSMAEDVSAAAQTEFGIHSPSKVFAEFGRYIDEGLAEGIRKTLAHQFLLSKTWLMLLDPECSQRSHPCLNSSRME